MTATSQCEPLQPLPVTPSPILQDSVTAVVVSNSDIIACSVDGSVRRFDMRMGRMYVDELHHPVTSCAISHDGQCVLAACLDSTLRLLDRCELCICVSFEY